MTETKVKTRNIVLIGRTGNGKSTLANVLVNKVNGNETSFNDFKIVFRESDGANSATKHAQIGEFEDNVTTDGKEKIKYRIIDTIGIGDTELSQREVLSRIAEVVKHTEEGINQILFVTRGRFTNEEVEAYNLLRTVVFNDEVVRNTTIVRTGFHPFRNAERCATDTSEMKNNEQNKDMAGVMKSCRKIIHVDNPPIDSSGDEEEYELGLKRRAASRKILMTLLHLCDSVYKPESFEEISKRVQEHKCNTEKLEEEKNNLQEQLQKQEELSVKQREELEATLAEVQKKQQEATAEFHKALKEQAEENNKRNKEQEEERKKEFEVLLKEREILTSKLEECQKLIENKKNDGNDSEEKKVELERFEAKERVYQEELKKLKAAYDEKVNENKQWQVLSEH